MNEVNRRDFFKRGLSGLAVVGLGTAGLVLPACADPTASSGKLGAYGDYLKKDDTSAAPPTAPDSGPFEPTETNIQGPFYRQGAPFRAKVTPPLADGTVLVLRGRVWGHDTKKPLAHAILDIWQANAEGRYDNDDSRNPPRKGVYHNRARLITDETGFYEYETVVPGRYKIGARIWRPAHIHYLVRHPGYRTLVTQLYFAGDPHNATDPWVQKSLITKLHNQKVRSQSYKQGVFDIVLAQENNGQAAK